MNGNFSRGRELLALALFLMAPHRGIYGQAQVPCPVAILSAKAEKDTIQLEFVNKGKVPVEQLSVACVPSGTNKFPKGICHVETGIFYPNTASWIRIDYLGANRHPPEISVTQLRLNGGALWEPTPANRCKNLRVTRKN